ncbi:GNAT superfamily N-acetyltransferase [Lewinella aquimaris]|uniref:GNAT superfamily N-acetyltransferase n=1 Tax=Neolewinella aquimaris TaxID=1835722 RepID=A0A840E4D3_9BACT|nr:GNAT family N-acetyltransferase [Neolewinella aquimaris]MBB4078813.1 GNAT superfamily N-acetyltransferase [Neolewinella aquimaris]
MPISLRPATAADVPAIAALHARSWRENYAGEMSATYLKEEAAAERLAEWHRRFAEETDRMRVILAEGDGALLGFCCVMLDHSAADGSLLDNLHVRADQQGTGLGKRLMRAGAACVRQESDSDRLYLWVLAGNTRAREVYHRLGGRTGRTEQHRMPGTEAPGATAISVHFSVADLLA